MTAVSWVCQTEDQNHAKPKLGSQWQVVEDEAYRPGPNGWIPALKGATMTTLNGDDEVGQADQKWQLVDWKKC